MADRKLSTSIIIGGAVDGSLGKAFGEAAGKANSLEAELKRIGRTTKDIELFKRKGGEMESARTALGQHIEKLAQMRSQALKTGGASAKLAADIFKQRDAVATARKALAQKIIETRRLGEALRAAGVDTRNLDRSLTSLSRRQALLQGRQGRLRQVSGMLTSSNGLQFGATSSAIIRRLVASETFGGATTSILGGLGAILPILTEVTAGLALLGAAVAAAYTGIFMLGKSAAEFIDETADMADGLGITTNKLLGLRFAASQSGIESDKLDEKLGKLTASLESAKDGTGPAYESLRELGLTYQELAAMNPDEQVLALADAFKEYNGNVPKVSLANALFGKNSARFVNMLNQGGDAIRRNFEEARRVGYYITKEQEDVANRFDISWQTTLIALKSAWLQIGSELIPIITGVLKDVVNWFKDPQNRAAIVQFGKDLAVIASAMAKILSTGIQLTQNPIIRGGLYGATRGGGSGGVPGFIAGAGVSAVTQATGAGASSVMRSNMSPGSMLLTGATMLGTALFGSSAKAAEVLTPETRTQAPAQAAPVTHNNTFIFPNVQDPKTHAEQFLWHVKNMPGNNGTYSDQPEEK